MYKSILICVGRKKSIVTTKYFMYDINEIKNKGLIVVNQWYGMSGQIIE